jgi:hypothetical protein
LVGNLGDLLVADLGDLEVVDLVDISVLISRTALALSAI